MVENTLELNEPQEIAYRETFVSSFEEATSQLIKADERDPDSSFRFLIVDIDGVLIDNNFVEQLPFVSHLFSPSVEEGTRRAFEKISTVFEERMAIATNRDRNVRILWNSDKVMSRTDDLVSSIGHDIPIYEKMQKQIPSLARDRAIKLVEYIACSLVQGENSERKKEIILNSVEDVSIVSPNRETFLKYIAKGLYEELGMKVSISNYVIEE